MHLGRTTREPHVPFGIGGKNALLAQGDKHPLQTGVQQLFRRTAGAGPVSDLHPGKGFRLHAVGLEGVELPQNGPHLLRLHRGHRVHQQRRGAVVGQVGQGAGGQIGVGHHQGRPVEVPLVPGKVSGGELLIDSHVGDRQGHVPRLVAEEQIGGRGSPRHVERPAQVNPQPLAGVHHLPGVGVLSQRRQQGDLDPQQP